MENREYQMCTENVLFAARQSPPSPFLALRHMYTRGVPRIPVTSRPDSRPDAYRSPQPGVGDGSSAKGSECGMCPWLPRLRQASETHTFVSAPAFREKDYESAYAFSLDAEL
ncbi:hypothetical protein OH76DRAFT_597580 [Lentinus brumalis]|uniref:Uncharacterized protein n=1 Tax=Lentinus brumalis TaxID=2498619 RepID=A0A371DU97_9APHY|nr:hypothetical protein OH76DRAFT_597580 [Polyporus brumalis]